jgi:hypothetical protein
LFLDRCALLFTLHVLASVITTLAIGRIQESALQEGYTAAETQTDLFGSYIAAATGRATSIPGTICCRRSRVTMSIKETEVERAMASGQKVEA